MRRNLPLVVAGALSCVTVLAACSGDDTSSDDTTPIISLVQDTTPELVDKCATDYVPSSTEPAAVATAASAPAASQAATTPESSLLAPAASTEPSESTSSTEPTASSESPASTEST